MATESDTLVCSLYDLISSIIPVGHGFELLNENLLYYKHHRIAPNNMEFVKVEIGKILKTEVISASASFWAFPVVIVTNKDGKSRILWTTKTCIRE